MANRFLNNIRINDAYTFPASDGTNGQVITTDGSGNLTFADQTGGAATSAESLNVTVKNVSGGSLSKGTIVHAAPTATPPSGNVIEVIVADYDTSTDMPAIAVLNETIANEAEGEAIMFGAVSGIDTSSFSIGDELWVGNNGAFTNTKPATAGQLIQKIAVVIKSHASNGLIKVFGAGRTNDVPLPLYIDNTNQRVGISIATPSVPLHVNGFARFNGGIQLDGNNRTIYAIDNTDLLLGTNNTERLRIDSSGNVGIGTSPDSDAELHVYRNGSAARVRVEREFNTQLDLEALNGYAQIGTLNNFPLAFQTNGTERMRIDTSGNVGIGTTSLSQKLTVNGDASATIFYDYDDTAYYVDPASTSNLNALTVGGSAVWTSGNDGSGSGLDADLLDGVHGSSFVRSDADDSLTGAYTITNDTHLNIRTSTNGGGAGIDFSDHAGGSYAQKGTIDFFHADGSSYGSGAAFVLGTTEATSTILADGKLMYGEGIYSKPATGTGAGTRKDSNWDTAYGWGNHASAGYLLSSSYTASDVLTKIKTVDGSGSGLDADLLDGINSTSFLRSDTSDTFTTLSGTRVNLNSTNNSSFLTGDSLLSADGYIMVKGIVNTTEAGSQPAAIVFGNGSTYGSDKISLVTSGATRLYVDNSGNVTMTAHRENVSVISTNTSAVVGQTYVLTASLTLTLPASLTAGDKIKVSNMSGTTTPVIARNGSNIMGLAENLTLDVENIGITLVYSGDATKGWVII